MKKIHRFLVPSIPNEQEFEYSDKRIVHQCASVLALKKGEEIIFFENGGDDQVVSILSATKRALTLRKERILPKVTASRDIVAAVAIPKGAAFELIVQKLTELGVHTIIPLKTARTVKSNVRTERLQAISDEALEQSGGSDRVTIHEPMTLEECTTSFPFPSIIFDQHGGPLPTLGSQETLVVYVGPEGGWSEGDDEIILSRSFAKVSLGTRVLRTETAAIVGVYELLRGA